MSGLSTLGLGLAFGDAPHQPGLDAAGKLVGQFRLGDAVDFGIKGGDGDQGSPRVAIHHRLHRHLLIENDGDDLERGRIAPLD